MQEPVGQRVGYLIKRAQHAMRTAMDAALRDLGISTPQYAALSLIAEEPGLSNAELARRAFVTAQTMNEILAILQTRGLIERQPHPGHGRILQAHLTATGKTLLNAAHERVTAIEAQMVSDLDMRERQQLVHALERCVTALRR